MTDLLQRSSEHAAHAVHAVEGAAGCKPKRGASLGFGQDLHQSGGEETAAAACGRGQGREGEDLTEHMTVGQKSGNPKLEPW